VLQQALSVIDPSGSPCFL